MWLELKMKGYGTAPHFIDWGRLASLDPELRSCCRLRENKSGIRIDWRKPNVRYIATRACLRYDFGFAWWDMPRNDRLIPCVPNRLAYLWWVRDIVGEGRHRCLEIGAGCSAVMCLLAYKCFGWQMVGTETDNLALQWARRNTNSTPIDILTEPPTGHFDVCVCNPPFFKDTDERRVAGTASETKTDGGEVAFVMRHIAILDATWYTTLLGRKSSVKALVAALRRANEVRQVTFKIGRTARWAVAWRAKRLEKTIKLHVDRCSLVNFFERRGFMQVDGGFEAKGGSLLVKVAFEPGALTLSTPHHAQAKAFNELVQAAPGELGRTNRRWRRKLAHSPTPHPATHGVERRGVQHESTCEESPVRRRKVATFPER